MIYLVAGYKGSGKDTLYLQVSGKKQFNWMIYRRPGSKKLDFLPNIKRVAFADPLKRTVIEYLQKHYDSNITLEYCESHKEDKVYDGKSYRDYCIEEGRVKREININHWCELALLDYDSSKNYMITDFRFTNEYDYSSSIDKCITIRVYRSCVPIPDKHIESEHALDNFETDYLLVLSEDEFRESIKLFPQYKFYKSD